MCAAGPAVLQLTGSECHSFCSLHQQALTTSRCYAPHSHTLNSMIVYVSLVALL